MSDNEHVQAIREIATQRLGSGKYNGDRDDIIRHADKLATQLAEAEARAERLRKALRSADSRIVQYKAEEYMRRTGDLPSREWFLNANGVQESNHYAIDGLEFGDFDDAPGDGGPA